LRPQDCELVATGSLDEQKRTGRFDAVEPGQYLLVLRVAPFAAQPLPVELTLGERAERDVELPSYTVYGHVTVDDAPARVRLEFASGIGVTDSSGQYYASLSAAPRDLPVRIIECGTDRLVQTHVPEAPIAVNEPYDIALVRNEIDVDVVDAVTNAPLPGAAVNCGVLSDVQTGAGSFLEAIDPTDERGRTTIAYVPSGRDLIVCASTAGYARACTEPLVVKPRSTRAVTVRLQRNPRQGRVLFPEALQWGWLYFVTSDGATTERVPLSPDGSFTARRSHNAPEYVVVASNLPLAVMPLLPDDGEGDLELRWPIAREVRTIDLTIAPENAQKDALVALRVGGLYVPNQAFVDHQLGRGAQAEIYGRGPLRVSDIIETGPIDVILGPAPEDPALASIGADLFILPQFRAHFQVKRVTWEKVVAFD
jgi:hypothetical protein